MLKKIIKKAPVKAEKVAETKVAQTYGIYKDEILVKTFNTKEEAEEQARILGMIVR